MKVLIAFLVCSLAFSAPIAKDEFDVQSTLDDLEALGESNLLSEENNDDGVIPIVNDETQLDANFYPDTTQTPPKVYKLIQYDTQTLNKRIPFVQDESSLAEDEITQEDATSQDEDSAVENEGDETFENEALGAQDDIHDASGVEQDASGAENDASGTEQDASGVEQDASGTEQDALSTEQDASGTEQDASGTEQDTSVVQDEEFIQEQTSDTQDQIQFETLFNEDSQEDSNMGFSRDQQ